MTRKRVVVTLLVVIAAVVATLFGVVGELMILLLFGWMMYLARILHEVTVRWDGVAFFLIGLAVLTLLLHRIAVWLRREMSDHTAEWQWRSTLLLVGLLIMAFIAGVAMVGVTHQVTWLAVDDEPLLIPTLGASAVFNASFYQSANSLKQTRDVNAQLP